MAANIKDVALRAGVSTATVSHVLNGTRPASAETRERVLSAVQELGYSQNLAARHLARGKSSLLGLLVSDVRNPFFPEITAAFQDEALHHGMDALLMNTNYDSNRILAAVKRLIGLQVPGIAVLTSQIDPSVVDMLAENKIPAVYLDLGRVGPSISNLVLEYARGIHHATEYLVGLGHRKIAYIGGPPNLLSARNRRRAFREAALRLGLPESTIVDSDFSARGGYAAADAVFKGERPTAILCANDLTAFGVLHCAFDCKIAVPDELSVIGFDDISFSQYTQPALTTISVPRAQIGQMAFEELWRMINETGREGTEIRIPTTLIVRGSATAVRRSS